MALVNQSEGSQDPVMLLTKHHFAIEENKTETSHVGVPRLKAQKFKGFEICLMCWVLKENLTNIGVPKILIRSFSCTGNTFLKLKTFKKPHIAEENPKVL